MRKKNQTGYNAVSLLKPQMWKPGSCHVTDEIYFWKNNTIARNYK